jgi:hypothetical protein
MHACSLVHHGPILYAMFEEVHMLIFLIGVVLVASAAYLIGVARTVAAR